MKNIRPYIFSLIILSGSSLAPFIVYAEMYKWIDENGNTNYTEKRPPEDISTEIIDPPPTVDTKSAQKELSDTSGKADKRREDRIKNIEEKEKAEQELAENEEQCEKVKAIQKSYERPRVNYVNDDGSRRRGTEEERLDSLARAKENVNKFCNY